VVPFLANLQLATTRPGARNLKEWSSLYWQQIAGHTLRAFSRATILPEKFFRRLVAQDVLASTIAV
jgi:hypothetical protein